MTTNNEQISPAKFDVISASPPAHPAATDNTNNRTPRWVLPTLLALVFVAVLVVFWLPDRIKTQTVLTTTGNAEAISTPAPASTLAHPTGEEASPFSDAQVEKLRKQARDTLTKLLEAQSSLEDIGVQQWAKEAFAKAIASARRGDEVYRESRFKEARVNYEQGLAELQALLDMAPQVLQENLERARQAIDAGDEKTANAALAIVVTVEADNQTLPGLRKRASVMKQLFSLFAQAQAEESSADLAQAVNRLQQAVALDAESLKARSELQRVTRAYTTQRFNDAMSTGYQALNTGQFEEARSAFKKAARLVNGSPMVANALEDVASAETARRLADLQLSGQTFEAQEKWSAAVAAFEQALQLDGSLMIAQQGLERARARARLDQQLSGAIDQPERLSDVAVATATAQLLHQAADISPRGAVLQRQLTQLKTVLEKANTPIQVTLRSDMETEVTVRKVARLGHFQERVLQLRPGTYVAVGTRTGYRDVRRTFSY